MILDEGDIALRLLLATTLGAIIGVNRDLAGKAMGSRTLGLVALGACAVAVAGSQVPGMPQNPDALSRVIQGIIQGIMGGISFLGAGVIMRNTETQTVDGLTTAATVWATAALGIACALGAWIVVAVGTALAIGLLAAPEVGSRLWKNGSDGSGGETAHTPD